ncbi:MAG: DUF1501 domain-containing protein [Planctomycetaceae bacterium]|nr:DUF1501 domain-containing protein [Planctomycetaceae bacterium]
MIADGLWHPARTGVPLLNRYGISQESTDEFGFEAVENPVHLHDLHATILHLMGLDHELLTYFYQGREESLTDVGGKVVTGVLA